MRVGGDNGGGNCGSSGGWWRRWRRGLSQQYLRISGSDIYSVMDTAGRAVGTAICGHNRWSRDR